MVDWSFRDSVDGEVCETAAFVSEINRLIIFNNYLLIDHSLNEKHAASIPTMKDVFKEEGGLLTGMGF